MSISLKTKRNIKPILYMLPALIFTTIFIMIPIIYSAVMSVYNIPALKADWIFTGFKNYTTVFKNGEFGQAFFKTVLFGGFASVTSLGGGIFLALLLAKHRLLNFYRYIFYIPTVVSAVTMGRLWGMMLSPSDNGVLNFIIRYFGISPQNWLGNEALAYLVIMGIGLIGVGGGMTLIIFTTAINNIPNELNEAAILEGATEWQKSRHVTIPMIAPVLSSWALLSIIGSFKSFEFIYALTSGGPNGSTRTLAILLYESTQAGGGYGSSAAMGLLLTLIVLVFTLIYLLTTGFMKDSSIES
jgi:ABC-type sugar transport system permease subunit